MAACHQDGACAYVPLPLHSSEFLALKSELNDEQSEEERQLFPKKQ